MNAWLRSEIRIHKFLGLIFCLGQIWPLAIISKYFGPKKSGLGPPRAHSGQFCPKNRKWLFLRVKIFFPLSRLCVAGRNFFVITIFGPNVKLDSEPKMFLRLAHFWDDLAKNDQIMVFTVLAKNQCAPHCPCLLNVFLGGNYLNWRHIQDLDVRFWVEAIYSNFCVLAPF